MNNFTLDIHDTGIIYELNQAINIEKIKLVENNKIVVVGDTANVMVIEFGQN